MPVLPKMKWKVLLMLGGSVLAVFFFYAQVQASESGVGEFKQPNSLSELLRVPVAQLQNVDPARMNLLCAKDLPGSENLDVEAVIRTIDEWAALVAWETEKMTRSHGSFVERSRRFPTVNSEAQWKMFVLFSVLKDTLGINYNPEFLSDELQQKGRIQETKFLFYRDARDCFLNGIIERKMGACYSIPLIFYAIGKRLNYPVHLVLTKEHQFIRWDDGKERFNVETTRSSFKVYSEDHYKFWPYSISAEEISAEGYLKNLTPQERLANDLQARSLVFYANGKRDEGTKAFTQSIPLVTHWRRIAKQKNDALIIKPLLKSRLINKCTLLSWIKNGRKHRILDYHFNILFIPRGTVNE